MDKKHIFGGLSLISFVSILFMPSGSKLWILLAFLGIVFGLIWLKMK